MAVNRIDIKQMLERAAGVSAKELDPDTEGKEKEEAKASKYTIKTSPVERKQYINGTELYKKNHRGIWYFMPVYLRKRTGYLEKQDGDEETGSIELENALIQITAKKTIVETPLVGRKGTVKELINIDESVIVISAFICSDDGSWPEDKITALKELWELNQPLEIISVLTDQMLDEGEMVVITDMVIPKTEGVENGVRVDLTLKTDRDFDLVIDYAFEIETIVVKPDAGTQQ